MREVILAEIKRIAEANGGKPPGQIVFRRETGIPDSRWLGVHWARWSDALAEAGYSANAWQGKHDSGQMLRKLAEIVRERGAIPTRAELAMLRRSEPSLPDPKALSRHFGGQAGLITALRCFCREHDGFEHVIAILPETPEPSKHQAARAPEGWVYLLKSGQHHKIGRSDQLEARVKQISIALPESTVMVHAIRTDDPSGIEAYWHRRFAERRANGEWFKLTAADVAAFSRRKFQ